MRHLALVIVVVAFSLQSVAQSLKGKIVDQFNEPLENVYVVNEAKNTHTHTSENGSFFIEKTRVNDIIQVSILGFEKKTIKVSKADFNNGILIKLETKIFQLEELVLRKEINALQTITKIDLQVNPVNNSQEILRKVPGLFIGQHAGGGKAEQIFLRGFDIDHGTDITLSVDGMPINMVSHAHGQGYSDLHFVIPETIKNIDFGKGPYYANQGDFNTAGYVNFATKTALKDNMISVGYGDFNSFRTVAMFNLLESSKKDDAYVAIEYIETDGPFESPQNFNRLNLFAKYNTFLKGNNRLTFTASHFTSAWDASGQIPEREVANGNITRFGAIDDTEGGYTSRSNVNVQLQKTIDNNSIFEANAFYSNYNFELYSNFTFFLDNPVDGDQIKQFEDRNIFGMNAKIITERKYGNVEAKFTKGGGLRFDNITDNELSSTKNRRELLNRIQFGDVQQTNAYAFLNSEFEIGKFKISPALRFDYFKFLYNDNLSATYETLSKTKTIVNPKLNFLYTQNDNLQWFLKSGIGFHSNDARVVLQDNADKVLPRAYGADFGNIWKPTKNIVLNTAVWYLFSEEEFVYVGDAGIVEASGKSERFGIDLGIRYQLSDNIYFDTDATITKARSLEANAGEDYIPLAPNFTLAGGLAFTNLGRFSGGLRYRYIADRAANEDNSIVAEGYFVSDLNINYKVKDITFGVAIENLFDVAWNETQFATESRLQNEANSVEEIHFTPGTPFFAKATITYQF
ncbi:TonB-dependent receptor [Polaribacter dokdonensis]|uniref:Outer membrane receptor proteins, mostly Fe transport n=1 Tax=Polaribacter dokdonensis DSW-5 TaxID=1300348 RepID=A0A0M9CHF7_9FLAO|nr:TonB-dependent receptor plug domain-containing protein [Polaribacter dokdonensis]KOY52506.1 TonB dependent/ligand-gated channel [Polaribacter dokdonensis DSW-5]SEE46813.1 Outer membrane receptor proteins, mostly Fe transport [Polaribacter dokdonensis DSW-5]